MDIVTFKTVDIGQGRKGYIVTVKRKSSDYVQVTALYEYSGKEFICAGFTACNNKDFENIKSSAESFRYFK